MFRIPRGFRVSPTEIDVKRILNCSEEESVKKAPLMMVGDCEILVESIISSGCRIERGVILPPGECDEAQRH